MVLREIEIKKDITSKDCALLVQHAMRFSSEILLEAGTRKVNCKSVMGMISLGLKKGEKIILIVKGDDEEDAVLDIEYLFETNF